MTMTKKILCLSVCIGACLSDGQESVVNFRHLEHLTEQITLQGVPVAIVHVYANHPTYDWVDAKESGPEGVACVDDAGRAAVVYLRHFEVMRSQESLARAKQLLRFVMEMQAPDGDFYNFVFEDRSINREGKTSFKSFGWWAARGMWSLAHGFRVFRSEDREFASELRARFERGLSRVESLLLNYGQVDTIDGYRTPRWLLYESAADATSELVLGLVEYYKATGDARVGTCIRRLCEGLQMMQEGDSRTAPFGLHRSWKTMWHMWGNGQSQALTEAGMALPEPRFLVSAEKEAMGFYARLIIQGYLKERDLARPGSSRPFEQIAYAVRPMTVALIRLYEATSNEKYLVLAGLAASWLTGNNVVGRPMYDASTGRGFDGILDSTTINLNSGAESTIESLFTLVEAERFPLSKRFMRYRRVTSDSSSATFKDPVSGRTVVVALSPDRKEFIIRESDGN